MVCFIINRQMTTPSVTVLT